MEKNNIAIEDLLPSVADLIENGGTFRFTPDGNSMLPMLRGGKDEVVLEKACELQKGDIPLCRRGNGNYVLHRIAEVTENGYVLCGDNQLCREGWFKDSDVACVVVGYYRNKKYISTESRKYHCYVKYILPMWRLHLRIKRKAGLIIKGNKK